MLYNKKSRRNPTLKARFFLTVFSPAVMPAFIFTGYYLAESMKGGMLMKSKHSTYGKKTACRSFNDYHYSDNFRCKSTIAALCTRSAID